MPYLVNGHCCNAAVCMHALCPCPHQLADVEPQLPGGLHNMSVPIICSGIFLVALVVESVAPLVACRFAQVLADVAAAYELPVLLVNEQQSTKQASAVRSGKAAYDIVTLQELQQQQQQQQPPPQQQPQQGLVRPQQKRQADPGRDAYAAALILSRYYNDLVPVEVVPARPQQQQWRRPQLQEQQQQQRMERMQDQQGQMLPKQPRKPPRYLRQKQQQQ